MEAAAVVRGGVGDRLVVRELGQLVALRIAPDAARLVGEVDLVAVPGQLPHDRDRDDAGALRQWAHADLGSPQRARDTADRARVVGGVEDLQRPLHLQVGVGRHGAHVARAARGLRDRLRGLLAIAVALALAAARRRGRRGDLVGRDLFVDVAGPLAARAQAVQERAPAALAARMAQRESGAAGLADPALVLGARGAQLADLAPLAGREEVLGVLAAQESAPADVAGDVLLVGLDVRCAGHADRRV